MIFDLLPPKVINAPTVLINPFGGNARFFFSILSKNNNQFWPFVSIEPSSRNLVLPQTFFSVITVILGDWTILPS